MKSNYPEEDKSKERLREQLGLDPDKLLDEVSKFMELYRKSQLLQFPLMADLKDAMKELFEKQYQGIKPLSYRISLLDEQSLALVGGIKIV